MTLIEQLTAALERGYCPTPGQIKAMCTALHASMVEADEKNRFPEFTWMSSSFEDMADVMTDAMRCEANAVEDMLEAA